MTYTYVRKDVHSQIYVSRPNESSTVTSATEMKRLKHVQWGWLPCPSGWLDGIVLLEVHEEPGDGFRIQMVIVVTFCNWCNERILWGVRMRDFSRHTWSSFIP